MVINLNIQDIQSAFYITNIEEYEDGKLKFSVFKKIVEHFNKKMLQKTSDLVKRSEELFDYVKNEKLSESQIDEFLMDFQIVKRVFHLLDDVFSSFEYENEIDKHIVDNFFTLHTIFMQLFFLLNSYKEVFIANKEFEEGKTLSHNELLNECL